MHNNFTRRRLIQLGLVTWLLPTIALSHSVQAEQKTADEWFRQLGLLRGLSGPFSFTLEVNSYHKGVTNGETYLEVLFQSHQQVLVLFRRPNSVAGRRILIDGENMWLTLPSSQRILRVAPSQRLLGEASNGDVININFSDYALKEQRQVTHDGNTLIELTLIAQNRNQSYQRVVYLIDPVTALPRISLHYTAADKLIKEIHYERYITEQGQPRVKRLRLVNPVFGDRFTVMTLGDFLPKNFPSGIFKKENLLNLMI